MRITVFTPTYNRRDLLKRLYISLSEQTIKQFCWLIVDDGSTDLTNELVQEWQKISDFEILYIYQKNGGKARAHNVAVKHCSTEFFLIVDSDDSLTVDAIEVLNSKLDYLSEKENLSGVIGNRIDRMTNQVIGKMFPQIDVSTGIELHQKYNCTGDTLRMYKIDILKKYLFPEIEGEKFVPENVVFDKIDKQYKMAVLHELIYLGEYQKDGYSNNIYNVHRNNPIGYSIGLKSASLSAIKLIKKINYTLLFLIWIKKMHISETIWDYPYKFRYIMLIPISRILIKIQRPKFFFFNFDSGE